MRSALYYIGMFFQAAGLVLIPAALVIGIQGGDFGKEMLVFAVGGGLFLLGTVVRKAGGRA